MDITELQMNKNKYTKDIGISAIMTVKSRVKRSHHEMLEIIEGVEGVQHIEEL